MIRRPKDIVRSVVGRKGPIRDTALSLLEEYIKQMKDVGPLLTILRENRILRKIFEDMMPEFMDLKAFYGDLEKELGNARRKVVIYSPFTYSERLNTLLKNLEMCTGRGVQVEVITRPPTDKSIYSEKDHINNLNELKKRKVKVYLRDNFHVKLVVIDNKISYVGGVNVLSAKSDSVDVMLKLENEDFAEILLEKAGPPRPEEMF